MMKNFWVLLIWLFPTIIGSFFTPISESQLIKSESIILFQVQKLLEYPRALEGWSNWTNLCYLPQSPSLTILCFNNRVTELTIVGNKTHQTLSKTFSTDSLFTVVTKLSNLKVLSLVSLGIWGPLPAKLNRLKSLEVLNISSNSLDGNIPTSVSSMKSLKSLVLANNLFAGSVPNLETLASLEELDLGNNMLGPGFPSLGDGIVSLVLRNNSLRSDIPLKVLGFDRLQQLDISGNTFVGPIPAKLFSLPSIRSLRLAGNQLSGVLSANTTCSPGLKFVDISHNFLIGKLPACVASKSVDRTVLYSWNCLASEDVKYQHPYAFCHKEALAVKPPKRGENNDSGSEFGLILGIIGGIVGIVIVVGLIVLITIRRRNSRRDTFDGISVVDKMSLRSSPRPNIEAIRRVPQTMRQQSIGLAPYREFTLEEIEYATNNFDPLNLVEEGTQGKVYKGRLRDGSTTLVKCLKLKQKHLTQSLVQSIEAELPKLRHRHLISLLGHCTVTYQDHPNTSAMTVFVLLEHVSNGSLSDCITDWRIKELVKWPQRLAITIGVARGVQFLHTGVAPGIFGNNIKINNILLDDSLSGRISSYNIPLPSKVGLESPLRGQGGHSNSDENGEKEDIYQLGVVLLEVITGKLAKSPAELNEMKLQLERGLSEMNLKNVVEPSIHGSYAHQSVKTAIEIALNCLNKDQTKRPSIEDVLWNLQYSMQVQEGWTSSGNLSTQM